MKREANIILISLSIMYLISWAIDKVVINFFNNNIILRYVGLYIIGFSAFLALTSKMQTVNRIKKPVLKKHILILFMAQFFYLLITIISNLIFKIKINDLKITNFKYLMIIIIGPIFEEYVFRKTIAEKYSGNFILFSTITFAFVHIISKNISLALAALYSGLIWSILYYITNSFMLTSAFHILQNLFIMFISDILIKTNEKLLGLYIITLVIVGVLGLILLIKNQAEILPDKKFNNEFLKTKGFLIFIASMIFVSLV